MIQSYLRYVIYIVKRAIRDISSLISCQIHYLILYLRVKYQFHSFRNFQQVIWHENTIVKLFNVTSRNPTTIARFLMQIPHRKLHFNSLIIPCISVKISSLNSFAISTYIKVFISSNPRPWNTDTIGLPVIKSCFWLLFYYIRIRIIQMTLIIDFHYDCYMIDCIYSREHKFRLKISFNEIYKNCHNIFVIMKRLEFIVLYRYLCTIEYSLINVGRLWWDLYIYISFNSSIDTS